MISFHSLRRGIDVNCVHADLLEAFARYRSSSENLQRVFREQCKEDDLYTADGEERSRTNYSTMTHFLNQPHPPNDPYGIQRSRDFIALIEKHRQEYEASSAAHKVKEGPFTVEAGLAMQACHRAIVSFFGIYRRLEMSNTLTGDDRRLSQALYRHSLQTVTQAADTFADSLDTSLNLPKI